ncbi:MAG TPA: hypothetical protein VJG83_03820 [archaeon]|nr:hypothetical protein [archaeon]
MGLIKKAREYFSLRQRAKRARIRSEKAMAGGGSIWGKIVHPLSASRVERLNAAASRLESRAHHKKRA